MTWWRVVRHVIAVVAGWVFPWPSRAERAAAIADAREQKHRSQARLVADRRVAMSIQRMADENHYAERIARQITGERE